MEAWELYRGPAPFRQFYAQATDAQNAPVTMRMMAALIGLPLAAMGVVLALAGRHVRSNPKRWLRLLAGMCLLAALQAWLVRFSLPYGFGSSYDHASLPQLDHLSLSGNVGAYAVLLAAGMVVLSIFMPGRAAPHVAA